MNAQVKFAVSSKKALKLAIFATNGLELSEVGFTSDDLNEFGVRSIVVNNGDLTRYTSSAVADKKTTHKLELEGHISCYGRFEQTHPSADSAFRMAFIVTTAATFFIVGLGPKIWNFRIEGSYGTPEDVIAAYFFNRINAGPRAFDSNIAMYPDFWEHLLAAVFTEPTIINGHTLNITRQFVPSKLYFSPGKPADNILSVGGFCYDVNLGEFPRQQVNRGCKLWTNANEKRNTSLGVVSLGQLLVKGGNKAKKAQRETEEVPAVLLPTGRGVGRAFTDDRLKEVLVAPEPVKPVKEKKVVEKPQQQKAKKKA